MSVSYDVFAKAFLEKISEYKFLAINADTARGMIDGYMKRVLVDFDEVCAYDLTNFDDVLRELDADIDQKDLYEITDIVTDGMVLHWLRPYVFKQENMENLLSTRDYSAYSPSGLLNAIHNVYTKAGADYTQRKREYSYRHGDLSELHL